VDVNYYANPPSGLFGKTGGGQAPTSGIRDCLDGTSTTSAFSERIKGLPGTTRDVIVRPSASVMTITGTTADPVQTVYNNCIATNPATGTINTSQIGSDWVQGRSAETRYNHIMPPNGTSCSFDGTSGAWTASSRHRGAINMLMADGTVKAVKETIDVNVYRAIGTKAGNEAVSSSELQ